MRFGKRDQVLSRQRTLFGVDALERQVADLTDVIFRLLDLPQDVSRETLRNTVHTYRARGWMIQYVERQRSDYELGGSDGKE